MSNFMQAPKILWEVGSKYFPLSTSAKVMYMLMIDRYRLSVLSTKQGVKNWYDKNNKKYFIKFSNVELANKLGLKSSNTIISLKRELEAVGLIQQFARGQESACYFFVNEPDYENIEEDGDIEYNTDTEVDKIRDFFEKNKDSYLGKKDFEITQKKDIDESLDDDNIITIIKVDDKSLYYKWKIRSDCPISRRLFNYLITVKDRSTISDKEFWYIRNAIQSYEKNTMIVNYSSFVESLRGKYKINKNFIDVKVGSKTDIDIENEIINSTKISSDLVDSDLFYNYLE